MLPDYHVHTERCGHARGTAGEYVAAARNAGLPGIGISDHLPLLHKHDPELAMPLDALSDYVSEITELKRHFPGYVLLGIEADFRPDTLGRLRDLLTAHPFDYIIGSVHEIDGWAFDDPRTPEQWEGRDVDGVYHRYLELVGEAAECGLFTILGHLDLVKKFGHRPRREIGTEIERLAERIARSGVAVEINTSGLRKAVREIYPGSAFLRALARHRVPLTFGSDAHRPEEVGRDFDSALIAARKAGFEKHMVLRPDGVSVGGQLLVDLPEPAGGASE